MIISFTLEIIYFLAYTLPRLLSSHHTLQHVAPHTLQNVAECIYTNGLNGGNGHVL
jgi:hypothetical protein